MMMMVIVVVIVVEVVVVVVVQVVAVMMMNQVRGVAWRHRSGRPHLQQPIKIQVQNSKKIPRKFCGNFFCKILTLDE